MIKCNSVSVRIRKKVILDKVSVSFPKNHITVMVGKNGSGKTTLLRALNKTIPYEGKIFINGKDLNGIPQNELARAVSLMPQTLPIPHVTVEKLVAYGRSPHIGLSGILSPKDREKTETAILKTNLSSLKNSFTDILSGGERRRAFFAMMLAQDTEILLLDEPTSNLDTSCKKAVLNLIKESKAIGKTVIVILHDINDAFDIADRIIVMDLGKCIFEGTPKEAESMLIPQKIFGMEKLSATDEKGNKKIYYQ